MSRLKTCVVLAIAVLLGVSTASAGVLDGYSGALISGHTDFQGFHDWPVNTPGQESDLYGTIDWAVFGPGTFPAGFTAYRYNAGSWVSFSPSASDYVYSYQGFEVGDAPLSFIGVTLVSSAANIGYFSGNGVSGAAPFLPQFLPSQANWTFASTEDGGDGLVQPGTSSAGLFFTSPFAPTMLDGVVQDDGSSGDVVPLPTPGGGGGPTVPEPASIVAWSLLGLVGICYGGWRRSKSAAL